MQLQNEYNMYMQKKERLHGEQIMQFMHMYNEKDKDKDKRGRQRH